MPSTPSAVDLAAVAARFAELLRSVGVAVTPERAGRFGASIELIRPLTTSELYWLGRVTVAASPHEIAAYDSVFADVFRGLTDVADSRGDRNQPQLLPAFQPGDPRPPATDTPPTSTSSRTEPKPSPVTTDHADEDDSDDSDDPRGSPQATPASQDELLRHRDFADCTPEELAQLRRVVAAMNVSAPLRPSRRRRRHPRGDTIHRRATMRHARRTGGEPFVLSHRRPTERRRRVVLIADVSGSMEAYSRAYLYLLHGAVKALRAETFVFATRLTRLTRALRVTGSDPERALRDAVGSVGDWSGGTRIGEALKTFNDDWGRRGLARGAVVVIVSDGWETGDPAMLGEQMARLSRLAHRIVWVNPRAKSERYQPLVGGIAVALPYIDMFASGHTLSAFDEVLAAIAQR
jgi:uncharacterized protein